MSYDMWNYSATNTDAWVFGTLQVYRELAELLSAHNARDSPHRIVAGEGGGMDLGHADQPSSRIVGRFCFRAVHFFAVSQLAPAP